ncbi:DNA-binding MarR family transcriptional regulator [Aeromicrobium panaciterrae]|uniref:DNA-binding MarR family transcriptional regulator n=1 Tax=Aeromicrobium panaciterrae TaxID=363861 RepID=A0ABU1UMC9_9ACTN|nr:MarR family transcriptional regulator [Aeromicrobium panaciterrae]MDR7086346.1 DNA-binding MarR family transcriptional regulator [Aeromicrobium panaciterrae]
MPSAENTQRITAPFELHEAVNATLPDVNQDVALLHLTLLHLGRIVESSVQAVLAPEGLELSEHSVLSALWFAGPPHTMSPTQLSQVILQTTSGMSKTLRRIERLGLIERVADPNDGRARLVVLTSKGRETAERPLRQLVGQWTSQLDGVSAADLSRVSDALWKLVPHMDPRVTD